MKQLTNEEVDQIEQADDVIRFASSYKNELVYENDVYEVHCSAYTYEFGPLESISTLKHNVISLDVYLKKD